MPRKSFQIFRNRIVSGTIRAVFNLGILSLFFLGTVEATIPAIMPPVHTVTRAFGEARFSAEGPNRWTEWSTFTGKLTALLKGITPAFKLLMRDRSSFKTALLSASEGFDAEKVAAGLTPAKEILLSSLLYGTLLFLTIKTANDLVQNISTANEANMGRLAFTKLKDYVTRGDHGQKSNLTTKINQFKFKQGADPSAEFILLNSLFRELKSMGGKTFNDSESKITAIYNALPSNGDYDALTTIFETTRSKIPVDSDEEEEGEPDSDREYTYLCSLITTHYNNVISKRVKKKEEEKTMNQNFAGLTQKISNLTNTLAQSELREAVNGKETANVAVKVKGKRQR